MKRVLIAAALLSAPGAFASKVNCYGTTAQGQFIQVLNVESEQESRLIVAAGRFTNAAEIRVITDMDLGLKRNGERNLQVGPIAVGPGPVTVAMYPAYSAQVQTDKGTAEITVVIARQTGTPDEFQGKLEYPGTKTSLKCSEKP